MKYQGFVKNRKIKKWEVQVAVGRRRRRKEEGGRNCV